MKRRSVLAFFGAAPLASRPARAQRDLPVVGFMNPVSPATYRFNADAFREGLAEAGFVEGRNVRIEERWANGDYTPCPRSQPSWRRRAWCDRGDGRRRVGARREGGASTIPVVFTIGGDPVATAWCRASTGPAATSPASISSRPSSAPSACSSCTTSCPRSRRIALVMNPDNPRPAAEPRDGVAGAQARPARLVVNARQPAEIDGAFAELGAQGDRRDGDRPGHARSPRRDRRLAERKAFPSVSFTRPFAAAARS